MTTFAAAGRHHRAGEHEAQCSFCLRERSEVRALVTAPRVSICLDCAERCGADGAARALKSATPYRGGGGACSFCGATGRDDLIVAEHARICGPCGILAMEVFRENVARDPYDDRLDAELEALDE